MKARVCEDADNCIKLAIKINFLPDHIWIARIFSRPQSIADQHHRRGANFVVFWSERAAKNRLHAKRWEKSRGDPPHPQSLWIAIARQYHAGGLIRRHRFEDMVRRFPVVEIGHRNTHVGNLLSGLSNENDSAWIFVRERLQQHRIHHAENCGVRANSESQSQQRDRGDSRAAQ